MSYYNSGNSYRGRGSSAPSGGQRGSYGSGYQNNRFSGSTSQSGPYNRYGQGGTTTTNRYSSQQQQPRKQYGSSTRGNYQSHYAAPRSAGFSATGPVSGRPSDENQLWMGDLDISWTEESISSIWTSLGENPVGVKLMKDRAVPSKPAYCFVTFINPEAVARAMERNGQNVPGTSRIFKLNFASAGGRSAAGGFSGAAGKPFDGKTRNENSVFVGDLGNDVTDQLLLQKFNEHYPSQVRQVKVMFDPVTRAPKGFGFVRFYSAEAQKKALTEMNGVFIGSRPIRVGLAAGSASQVTTGTTTIKVDTPDVSRIQIQQTQPGFTQYTDPNNSTIVIRGLSGKFTVEELKNHVISFGDVIFCKLSKDSNSGFVKFYLRSAAEAAILFLHGNIINNCNIRVNWGNDNEATLNSKVYQKAKEVPLLYGRFDINNIHFESFTREQLETQLATPLEQSENLSASKVNELYIKSKLHNGNLLDSALY